MEEFEKEWSECMKQFEKLETSHMKFAAQFIETHKLETECISTIAKQKKSMKTLKNDIRELKASMNPEKVAQYESTLAKNNATITSMEALYPRPLSFLLRSLLGGVNVTLPVASDRLKYKTEYEDYKLSYTYYIIFFSILCYLVSFRELDALFQIILVTFYSVVTLREHILIANGSKILPWWLVHHYLAILLSTIMVAWPSGGHYNMFRSQFMIFSAYLGVVQVVQHKYQANILYKKRALGQSEAMEITSDVPTPALFYWVLFASLTVYAFQLFNAYCMATIILGTNEYEWQVPVVGGIFLTHAAGNFVSLVQVTVRKLSRKPASKKQA